MLDNDLVFIGPTADTLARMGDKSAAKREMAAAGLPLVPGTEGPATLDEARAAREAGYLLLLSGGRRRRQGDAARRRAQRARGALHRRRPPRPRRYSLSLYVEKAISPARHVEIQVLADTEGNVLTLGERECPIQRRHQKLIEESPSTALTPKLREEMESAAEIACDAIGRNAGTFEFLVGPDGAFYFIELNARLQVEHPVSELCTGIDLVREQLRVAAGEPLELTGRGRGAATRPSRVNAEDPACDFLLSPGRLERFRPLPGRESAWTLGRRGILDPAVLRLAGREVDRVGRRLPAAIARALRALAEFDVAGLPTTIPALRDVLRSDEFQSGRYSTSFLEDARSRLPALAGRRDGRRRAARRAALTMLYRWDVAGEPLALQQGEEVDLSSRSRPPRQWPRAPRSSIGGSTRRRSAGQRTEWAPWREMSYAWGSTSSRPGRCPRSRSARR